MPSYGGAQSTLRCKGGQCSIDSWDDFQRELKNQFLPENVEFIARRKLRQLRQTGTVRDYVKQFSALMLDIRDMSEKDKLFYFIEGLKPWVQMELQRQRVQDLASAMAAAERLTDFSPMDSGKKKGQSQGKEETSEPNKAKSGGASSSSSSRKDSSHSRSTGASSNHHHKPLKCILCGGSHKTYQCPQKAANNALLAAQRESSQDNSGKSETEDTHMGAPHLLNAIH